MMKTKPQNSIYNNDETIKGTPSTNTFEKEILTYLYALWKLQHDVCGIEEIVISPEAIEGAKFLMVLKSINVFQYIFEYSKNIRCRSFYNHLFAMRNPKEIMLKLNDKNETIDQYDLALFADTVNVKIQLFDFTLKNVNNQGICSIYPSSDCRYGNEIFMVKLKKDGPIFPLYHLPDDAYYS
uniref:Cilia- and flagella-associated protein 300 n=1 Tax=Strongyloides papillosus TaxID=174720 RepID=A0A0N5CI50_STREA